MFSRKALVAIVCALFVWVAAISVAFAGIDGAILRGRATHIELSGAIDGAMAQTVITKIRAANKGHASSPICLYINSPGGEVAAGGMIVDAMLASRRPIVTVDVAMAASMAAWIEVYGSFRYMAPHAVLMFHNASASVQGDLPHMASQVALLGRIVDGYNQRIAILTRLDLPTIRQRENEQWWMTAREAYDAHLTEFGQSSECKGMPAGG